MQPCTIPHSPASCPASLPSLTNLKLVVFAADWKKWCVLAAPLREAPSAHSWHPSCLWRHCGGTGAVPGARGCSGTATHWRLQQPVLFAEQPWAGGAAQARAHPWHTPARAQVLTACAARHTEVQARCNFSTQWIKIRNAAARYLWKREAKLHRIQNFHSISTIFLESISIVLKLASKESREFKA